MTVMIDPQQQDLPRPRGELSEAVVELLRGRPGGPVPGLGAVDPYGEDLHLALHTCYELHYHGFGPVDAGWEWDPGLLGLRAAMEQRFLGALRDDVPGERIWTRNSNSCWSLRPSRRD